ncbi:MAG TPA: threonine ammonia-lyase [Candidatus Dormibacteraeota bacterium]|nr:threonine ammonia-lyase [Candidatus Dormibacteraeota bacterium]
MVRFSDIEAARHRITGAIYYSPCPDSIPLSEITGMKIFCKLDNLQRTGSFKERGARNALAQLPSDQQKRGVIAASAGNHAQALAYQGKLLGIPATVVMPKFAPLVKVSNCQKLGATLVLQGKDFGEARAHAHEIAKERGLAYIDGYDDPAIIAGQGTMGLEVVEQVPDLDAVIIPVGGAGLLAGVSLAVKTLRADAKIVAVEAENVASFSAALEAGKPVKVALHPTLADGLAIPQVGSNAFEVVRSLVDQTVTVTEEEIAIAILRLIELEKSVIEGAAATSLAACLSRKLKDLAGKRVVLLLCGGNIDPNVLSRVIERGLVADGRLGRFTAVISDRPGGLADLATQIAATGASIKQVVHDRAFASLDVSTVHVLCTVETRNREHLAELRAKLKSRGVKIYDSK